MATTAAADVSLQAENRKSGEVALYDKSKKLGSIAASECFIYTGHVVTVLFLVWIGIEVDHNASDSVSDSAPPFIIARWLFVTFFLVEAIVRCLAMKNKRDILRCRVLIMDLVLLALLIIPLFMPPIPTGGDFLLQLCRGFRLFPWCHMKSLWKTDEFGLTDTIIRIVVMSLLLVVYLAYAFSITLTKITRDLAAGQEYFETVQAGMSSVMNFLGVSEALFKESIGAAVVYLIFPVLVIAILALAVLAVVKRIRKPSKSVPPAEPSVALPGAENPEINAASP